MFLIQCSAQHRVQLAKACWDDGEVMKPSSRFVTSDKNQSCFFHSNFFFLKKISPELTSAANSPLFAEEDWP